MLETREEILNAHKTRGDSLVGSFFYGLVSLGAFGAGVVGLFNGVASKNIGQASLGAAVIVGGLAAAWRSVKEGRKFSELNAQLEAQFAENKRALEETGLETSPAP